MSIPAERVLRESCLNRVSIDLNTVRHPANRRWSRRLVPFTHLRFHPAGQYPDDPFEKAFLDLDEDDKFRFAHRMHRPNLGRDWYIQTEADIRAFFHAEFGNPTLAAFSNYPLIRQSEQTDQGRVGIKYSFALANVRHTIAIGVFKTYPINPMPWISGSLDDVSQRDLLKELHVHAVANDCPQVFCFDAEYLLILQFRAQSQDNMTDTDVPIDCWLLPYSSTWPTLRYAFYRMLIQGIKRCIGSASPQVAVGNCSPAYRQYFSGVPMWEWEIDGVTKYASAHPEGYVRRGDKSGAYYWTFDDDTPVLDSENRYMWDTIRGWS